LRTRIFRESIELYKNRVDCAGEFGIGVEHTGPGKKDEKGGLEV
jgi:hypothetical protein